MSVTGDIGDLWDWWIAELRAMVPAFPSGNAKQRRKSDGSIRVSRSSVHIDLPTGEGITTTINDLGGELRRLSGVGRTGKRRQYDIVLEPGRFLERQLARVRLPRRRAYAMAVLDLGATPLDPTDAHLLFEASHVQKEGTSYFVARRREIEPLFAALEQASARPAGIRVRTRDGPVQVEPATRPAGLARQGLTASVAACVLALAATFAHAQWRHSDAKGQLDTTIEALEAEAKIVRTLLEARQEEVRRIEAVRSRKRQAVPLVRVWEELTRVMPDQAWVTEFSVEGRKVTFGGLSQAAANLIGAVEASPLFKASTFTGPVVKSPDLDGERFTIEMELEG